MGAPITLFGETDLERLKRMRKVEVEGLDDEGVRHTGTHAVRNVFLKGKQHTVGIDEVDDLAEFDDEGADAADQHQKGLQGEAGVSMTGIEAEVCLCLPAVCLRVMFCHWFKKLKRMATFTNDCGFVTSLTLGVCLWCSNTQRRRKGERATARCPRRRLCCGFSGAC